VPANPAQLGYGFEQRNATVETVVADLRLQNGSRWQYVPVFGKVSEFSLLRLMRSTANSRGFCRGQICFSRDCKFTTLFFIVVGEFAAQ
jgi:hypothetical protein